MRFAALGIAGAMFKSIGREIRHLPNHVVALFFAAPAFIYLDAKHIIASPIHPGLAHSVLLALSALCLAYLYADGAALSGPWERKQSRRRRDALRAAILVPVAVILCHAAIELLSPALPVTHVENLNNGGSLSYPAITGISEGIALAAVALLSIAIGALLFLGFCAPACAALYGLRNCLRESWQAWRRCYFRLCGLSMLAMAMLMPAMLLSLPLQAYWAAAGFNSPGSATQIRIAIDICNQIGPGNIALGGAVAAFLLGVVLWSYSRAVARLIEQPRG